MKKGYLFLSCLLAWPTGWAKKTFPSDKTIQFLQTLASIHALDQNIKMRSAPIKKLQDLIQKSASLHPLFHAITIIAPGCVHLDDQQAPWVRAMIHKSLQQLPKAGKNTLQQLVQ